MSRLRRVTSLILLLICFGDVSSLRDVKLLVEPPTVVRGGTAALTCARDMEGAPLYSVKWYRGNHEFYRYTPTINPNIMVFGLPGIFVDVNNSNGTQVHLKRLDVSLSGTFSCEVTADSPYFSTLIAKKFIDIVSLPAFRPELSTEKDSYQPGETLRANCTSAPSRPAANLTIYINDDPICASETSLLPSENGLFGASVSGEVKITPDMFPGGRLRVACQATVFEVYNSSANLDFFTPEADPRPERITLNNATRRCHSWILLILLLLLPMVVLGQYDDAFNEDTLYDSDSAQNNEDQRQRVLDILMRY